MGSLMLKFFRDQKDSWFVKGILILTALSFMTLFGVSSSGLSFDNKTVVSVGSTKVSTQELMDKFRRNVDALSRMTGGQFTLKDAVERGMLISTLRETGSRAAMNETVNHLGLAVPEDAVRQSIMNEPMFSGLDGTFSRSAFNEFLKNTGQNEKNFVADTFLDMKYAQIAEAVKAATVLPPEFAETAYRLDAEKRVVDVFKINPEKIKIKQKPTRKELEKTYEDISESLMAPEYRSFTVMSLSLDDVKKQINVSDSELRDLYEQDKSAYTVEEVRNVDQMLFDTQDAAQKAFDAVKKGEDFFKVAQREAGQTDDMTQLGDITPSTATADWSEAVFNAKKGEIVGPVQTSFGWQILRVNKITPKIEKKFAEVKKDLEEKVKNALAFDKLTELSKTLDDRLGAGEKLETVAKDAKLPVESYKNIDSAGNDENGNKTALPEDIVSMAFLYEQGRDTPMTENGSGYFVLRVDEVVEPTMKTYEKALPALKKAWTEQKQKEEAKSIIKKIEKDLMNGAKPKDAAKKYNVTYERIPDLTRRKQMLPSNAMFALFNRPVGEVVSVPAPNGYIVTRAVKVIPADPKKNVLDVAQLRRQIVEEKAAERTNALLNAFGEEFDLTINEDAANEAFGSMTKNLEEDYY